ncbi:hypothetical protein [Methanosarcina lacustris]|uniref:hypothetical protein n=1 Tax=Methanosarcina lacustris TaxID=170861 RepID=UPI001E64AEB9|nr:hypothetical protein [Methanosarcina lacustris]
MINSKMPILEFFEEKLSGCLNCDSETVIQIYSLVRVWDPVRLSYTAGIVRVLFSIIKLSFPYLLIFPTP